MHNEKVESVGLTSAKNAGKRGSLAVLGNAQGAGASLLTLSALFGYPPRMAAGQLCSRTFTAKYFNKIRGEIC